MIQKKILEADVRTESETDSSDITHCKVGCKENETYNNDCQPENESVESIHSQQQTVLTHKFKASKEFVKYLLSKASNTRRTNDHHSHKCIIIREDSIKNQKHEAAVGRRIFPREKSHLSLDKPLSGGSLLIPAPNSKSFNSPSCTLLLKISMISTNPDMKNGVEVEIAYCKQSYSVDAKDLIDTSNYL